MPHDPILQEKVDSLSFTVSNQEKTIRILRKTLSEMTESLSEMTESLSKARKEVCDLDNKLEKAISSPQAAVNTNSSAWLKRIGEFPSSPAKLELSKIDF
jgi:chromosome segregation ATPase